MSNSQLFKFLAKWKFECPSPLYSNKSATHASFNLAKANKEGKKTHKSSSSHHLSFQNLAFLPSPTKNETLLKKSHFFLIALGNNSPHPLPDEVKAKGLIGLFIYLLYRKNKKIYLKRLKKVTTKATWYIQIALAGKQKGRENKNKEIMSIAFWHYLDTSYMLWSTLFLFLE